MCQRQRTREIFRDFFDVESAALGRTQDEHRRLCVRSNKGKKRRGHLGPPASSISLRKYTTVQVCGDSKVVEKWINGTCAMGPKSIRRTAFVEEKECCLSCVTGR